MNKSNLKHPVGVYQLAYHMKDDLGLSTQTVVSRLMTAIKNDTLKGERCRTNGRVQWAVERFDAEVYLRDTRWGRRKHKTQRMLQAHERQHYPELTRAQLLLCRVYNFLWDEIRDNPKAPNGARTRAQSLCEEISNTIDVQSWSEIYDDTEDSLGEGEFE